MSTSTTQQRKLQTIYENLSYLRFPPFVVSPDKLTDNNSQFLMLGKYVQGGDSRLYLIQWLITKAYPSLLQQGKDKSASQRVQSKPSNLIKLLVDLKNALNSLGLLPISKFSKNIDPNKYVEGLLGYQNAVNSILSLTVMVRQTVQNRNRQKPDTKLPNFIKDLAANKANLVNPEYDPFGITFPQMYSEMNERQFQILFESTVDKIKSQHKSIGPEIEAVDEAFLQISTQLKSRYKTTLQQMVRVVQNTVKKSHNLRQLQAEPLEKHRLIEIDNEFNILLRKFTNLTSIPPQDKNRYITQRELLMRSIEQL